MDALLIPTLLCPKAWESMPGDVAVRFCSYCKKHVHNLETMSVSERLALLSSPAASVCARYKVAIRRPAKGKEESYMRHLLKYGAGVALAGSVLVVLWEMHAQGEKQTYYRAAAGLNGNGCEMPSDYYKEHVGITLGWVIPSPAETEESDVYPTGSDESQPIDLKLDPTEVDKLLKQMKPPAPEPMPTVTLQTG